MARPKLGESETQRLQLKITEAEVTAIDDWRFANRVPSRSEAVRRLCQIGLLVEQHLGSILDNAGDVKRGLELIERLAERSTHSIQNLHADDILDLAEDVAEAADELLIGVTGFWNSVVPYADSIDVSDARTKSADEVTKTVQMLEEHMAKAVERHELRLMMMVINDLSEEQRAAYEAMEPASRNDFMSSEIEKLRRKHFVEATEPENEK